MRHGYKPPDANPVFQYHVVIIIISTIIINTSIIIFIFILSLLMGIKKVVNEVISTISNQFFLQKDFKRTKTQIKPKPTKQIKLCQHKTTKARIFRA